MIWSLAREQLRSQRRYVAAAAVVVILAVATAVYAGLLGVTVSSAAQAQAHALVQDAENASAGEATTATDASGRRSAPPAQIRASVEAAQAEGTRVGALASLWNLAVSDRIMPQGLGGGHAAIGDTDWAAIVVEGTAPASGQVALSAAYAEQLGVEVGDEIALWAYGSELGETVTVSGITRSAFSTHGLSLFGLPELWIAWDDLDHYGDVLSRVSASDQGDYAYVTLHWDGSSPALADLFGIPQAGAPGYDDGESTSTFWIFLATGALAIGAVAMAFAFGRAQAKARTQWVATARALGASRRHVVLATLWEAGALLAAGFVIGFPLGYAATAVHLAAVHQAVPDAVISSLPTLSWAVAGGALVLAVVLGVVIAGVPAFWASRVSPVAALKPENDVTTAEVSRRVTFWPVALAWAATGVGAVLTADSSEPLGGPVYATVLQLFFMVLGIIVANEATRWCVTALGRWMSRRSSRALMVAGDAIVARPRQYSVPSFLLALGVAAVLYAGVTATVSAVSDNAEYLSAPGAFDIDQYITPDWLWTAAVIVIGALTVLATVIAVATSAATAREGAVREALGVTPTQTRVGVGLAHAVSLGAGIAIGVLLAAAVVGVWFAFTALPGLTSWDARYEAYGAVGGVVAGVLGVSLGLSAVSSLLVGRFAPSTSPLSRVEVSA